MWADKLHQHKLYGCIQTFTGPALQHRCLQLLLIAHLLRLKVAVALPGITPSPQTPHSCTVKVINDKGAICPIKQTQQSQQEGEGCDGPDTILSLTRQNTWNHLCGCTVCKAFELNDYGTVTGRQWQMASQASLSFNHPSTKSICGESPDANGHLYSAHTLIHTNTYLLPALLWYSMHPSECHLRTAALITYH